MAEDAAETQEEMAEVIRRNVEGPESAEADGVRVKQHPLRDQIEVDKHLARKRAGANPAGALKRVKIVPPGTT